MKRKLFLVAYMLIATICWAGAICSFNVSPFNVRIGAKIKGRAQKVDWVSEIKEGQISYYWTIKDSLGNALETGNVYSPITWEQQGDSVWIINNLADSLGVTIIP
jgi:hypothetical protein